MVGDGVKQMRPDRAVPHYIPFTIEPVEQLLNGGALCLICRRIERLREFSNGGVSEVPQCLQDGQFGWRQWWCVIRGLSGHSFTSILLPNGGSD